MGNCMRSGSSKVSADLTGDELIMVMKMDGKIMEFTAPLLVSDLTAAYPQHSVVHSGDLCLALSPDCKLLPGQLYCLLIPNSPSHVSKKNNNPEEAILSEPKSFNNGRISREREENNALSSLKSMQNGGDIIRVKMVISKQELDALLANSSLKDKSMERLLHQLESKAQNVKKDYAVKRCNGVWRPSLESIPEII